MKPRIVSTMFVLAPRNRRLRPTFQLDPRHSLKFAYIICGESQSGSDGMTSNQHIVRSNPIALPLQFHSNAGCSFGCGAIER